MRRIHVLVTVVALGLLLAALGLLARPLLVNGSSGSQVLYQETWRSDAKGWSGAGGSWKAGGGVLAYRGGHFSTLLAPFRMRSTSFAIEARIRLLHYLGTGVVNANSFGIMFRARKGSTGHAASGLGGGVFEIANPGATETYSVAIVTTPDDPNMLPGMANNEDFDPGKKWHTYRVEARGPRISFFIDGQDAIDYTDRRFASASQVGLFNSTAQVQVSSFRVIRVTGLH